MMIGTAVPKRVVEIPGDAGAIHGDLAILPDPHGLIILVDGSSPVRLSSRSRRVARVLHSKGLATLLIDLRTPEEEMRRARQDSGLAEVSPDEREEDMARMSGRILSVASWVRREPSVSRLPLGLFGAGESTSALLVSAALDPEQIQAVVARGGGPDLAGAQLERVQAPTLFLVGSHDRPALEHTQHASDRMTCERKIAIVPEATQMFEEAGTLDQAAALAASWFTAHLRFDPAQELDDRSDTPAGAEAAASPRAARTRRAGGEIR